MLELQLVPEKSLASDQWVLILGMHFSQAVDIIQQQAGVIRGVQVHYSNADPLNKDFEINLSNDGIRLRFDPYSQRLKIIEIYNLELVKLKYNKTIFNSEDVLPTRDQIEFTFGATLPAEYKSETDTYVISFRGVSFHFPAENFKKRIPVSASLISVHSGSDENNVETPPIPTKLCLGEVFINKLVHLEDLGLDIDFYTGGTDRHEFRKRSLSSSIYLGETPQEITTKLGTPACIFYKLDDKMKIHSERKHTEAVGRTDYFFNYFTLGIDILFDGKTHKARKFILHTNYPGHFNFNMYHRCEFLIKLKVEIESNELSENEYLEITPYTKWETIKKHLPVSKRPVVVNRSKQCNTLNLFGPTFCHGYKNLIFEFMPNDHIGSIIIYNSGSVF